QLQVLHVAATLPRAGSGRHRSSTRGGSPAAGGGTGSAGKTSSHPPERGGTGPLPEGDEQTFLRILADSIRVAGGTGLPHAFMGGIASTALGRPRWTHDIDLCVRREDARAILAAFADAGYDTEETDQAWLYKAMRAGVLVDVIFESTGGLGAEHETR